MIIAISGASEVAVYNEWCVRHVAWLARFVPSWRNCSTRVRPRTSDGKRRSVLIVSLAVDCRPTSPKNNTLSSDDEQLVNGLTVLQVEDAMLRQQIEQYNATMSQLYSSHHQHQQQGLLQGGTGSSSSAATDMDVVQALLDIATPVVTSAAAMYHHS